MASQLLDLDRPMGGLPPADAVRIAIAEAWREMMPGIPFDTTLTWREAGIDSLKSLQLLLSLEERLGQSLSFDMITQDLTVDDLIAALSGSPGAARVDPLTMQRDLTLFLVPGLYGDEPILAEFRRSLEGEINIETLALPDLDQPSKILGDIRRSAEVLVEQIRQRQPEGPLYIGGYSIGGLLAFQAANDLIEIGREVRLVCLLDSMLYSLKDVTGPKARSASMVKPPLDAPPLLERLGRRAHEDPALYLERLLYRGFYKLRLFEYARRIAVANAHRHDAETNLRRRRRLIRALRSQAMMVWRPDPCPAPTLLVTSEDFSHSGSLAKWRKLCSDLTVQAVAGGHHEIFDQAALKDLKPTLLAAIDGQAVLVARGFA